MNQGKKNELENNVDKIIGKSTDKKITVPYTVHESDMARTERTIKRLIAALLIISCAFVAFIAFDRYQDSQYKEEKEYNTQTNEKNGNAVINEGGDVEIG